MLLSLSPLPSPLLTHRTHTHPPPLFSSSPPLCFSLLLPCSPLQRDCDQWAPGIEIIAVRVTKPRVPDKIVQGFVQIENEKTQLQISEQEQKVAEKRAETKRKEASIRAQAELEVAEIQLRIQVANQEAK